MIIKLNANLKLRNGMIMQRGKYDDANQEFPPEIYKEIDYCRDGKRDTITVMQEKSPKANKKVAAKATEKELNTEDKGSGDLQTAEKKKTDTPKKRKSPAAKKKSE